MEPEIRAQDAPTQVQPEDVSGQVQYKPLSLSLPKALPVESWNQIGVEIGKRDSTARWWLADWWRYGDRNYGEAADKASPTGYSAKSLQNMASVARAFVPSRRRETLSFSHHEAMVGLNKADQEELLDLAEAEGWSVATLRSAAREYDNDAYMMTLERVEPGEPAGDVSPQKPRLSLVPSEPGGTAKGPPPDAGGPEPEKPTNNWHLAEAFSRMVEALDQPWTVDAQVRARALKVVQETRHVLDVIEGDIRSCEVGR